MNKKSLLILMNEAFNHAADKELGITGSAWGYIDKGSGQPVEIEYNDIATFDELIAFLNEQSTIGKIDFVDTNNMGYMIYQAE